MKLVEVEWQDAHADLVESSTREDLDDFHHPLVMRTVGWLLRDDQDGVTVANEHCSADQTYRGRTFIPRPLVNRVRIIRQPKTKTHQRASSDSSRADRAGDLLAGPESSESVG